MATAVDILTAKFAMPFAKGTGGELAHTEHTAHGFTPAPWSPVTSPVELARCRNIDRRAVEVGLGTLPFADPPAGYRLVPHADIRNLKVASLCTMKLIDLYAKPERDWTIADKALAAEFGTAITAFDATHKTAGILTFSAAREAAQHSPHYAERAAEHQADVQVKKLWHERLNHLLARRGELPEKQAAGNELTRVTAKDAPPTGTEVHPPLMANPYRGTDPVGEKEYENGYQHAQSLGHMTLSLAPPEQWAAWGHNGPAWIGGFSAGAASVGSQPPNPSKVSHMITAVQVLCAKTANAKTIGAIGLGAAGLGALTGAVLGDRDEPLWRRSIRGAVDGASILAIPAGMALGAGAAAALPFRPDSAGSAYGTLTGAMAGGGAALVHRGLHALTDWVLPGGQKVTSDQDLSETGAKIASAKRHVAHGLIGAGVGAGIEAAFGDSDEPLWRRSLLGAVGGGTAGMAIPAGMDIGLHLGRVASNEPHPSNPLSVATSGLGSLAGAGMGLLASHGARALADWVLPGGQKVTSDQDLSETGAVPAVKAASFATSAALPIGLAAFGAGLHAGFGDAERPMWQRALHGAAVGGTVGLVQPAAQTAVGNWSGNAAVGGLSGIAAGIASGSAAGALVDWILPSGQKVTSDQDLSETGARPA